MHKYGESKTTRIMMATVRHVENFRPMELFSTECTLPVLFVMGKFVSLFTISENVAANTFDCRVLYVSQILSFKNEVEQMSFCYHTAKDTRFPPFRKPRNKGSEES